jgi:hypothetical protein
MSNSGRGSTRGSSLERTTERPPFDPDAFARASESTLAVTPMEGDEQRPTSPPQSSHARLRESCKEVLAAVPLPELSDVPALGAVAVLLVAGEDLAWFQLAESTQRTIISHVDGRTIVEDVLAKARVEVDLGLRLLSELAREGIVGFRAAT